MFHWEQYFLKNVKRGGFRKKIQMRIGCIGGLCIEKVLKPSADYTQGVLKVS